MNAESMQHTILPNGEHTILRNELSSWAQCPRLCISAASFAAGGRGVEGPAVRSSWNGSAL